MIGNIGIEEEYIDILNNISKFHFNFNEKDFLEFAKYDINFIYTYLKNSIIDDNDFNYDENDDNISEEAAKQYEDILKKKYDDEILIRLLANKKKYRLLKRIDSLSIQHVRIYSYDQANDEIKIALSMYFYDDLRNNNEFYDMGKDMFWNDTWLATYEYKKINDISKLSCHNCGAPLTNFITTNILKCDFCNTIKIIASNSWKLKNIDVI